MTNETRIPANVAEAQAEFGFMALENGFHLSDLTDEALAGVLLYVEGEADRRGISVATPEVNVWETK